ncbi:acyl-CoA carboxylase subunit epsilon [Streptomyces coelicoflavus]|uniref:Acyl-CoA carboxylase subunit epsilon n=1 Tax=Streptomyces coelicoflavus TaxID=285562 RepID=A0A7K3PXZ3_9ACTN|nr:acyl-CoA carboxylase subunit epsilon [Streptomyces coelicoflavus]NEB13865.1 acyl-CoA carboxylase subunit epsilon [Streptomyces coelicoflavus]
MAEPDSAHHELRIERGHAGEEELAALTAVLCSILAGQEDEGEDASPDAPSWRPERPAGTYRSPYSWR